MATHDFVYQTFVIYLFMKGLVFAPLLWLAFMYWWSKRQNVAVETNTIDYENASAPQPLLADEPLEGKQAA
jgi:hypothetical protein